ncbi:hypothetical protein AYL99_00598 [Fonsecaea erecta]|uniref:Uncharacterized protein n=1 Tax=Fonsecaea erecta TaxID=1367422 RepID=A0A178ZZ16_9EURO|nr:hypothetical protein AYL99_00598 [Fonsecaea erecta]OAP64626.1 hypothetical protein AYL99_00598 [Fonsecaea erecta]
MTTRSASTEEATPLVQLHGKPVKWDRIRRFSRPPPQAQKRTRRTAAGVSPIGERIHLDLHPNAFRSTVDIDERILFLTKSYLDWNFSFWTSLGFAQRQQQRRDLSNLKCQSGNDVSRVFNKCFYNAIPLLFTNNTVEAFKEINLACSLASHCIQKSPYWIFLRLLHLYS